MSSLGSLEFSERQVTEEEGREWAEANGLYFIEASAKTAQNVEQVRTGRKKLVLLHCCSIRLTNALLLALAHPQAFSRTAATILANFDYVNHQMRKGSSRITLDEQQRAAAAAATKSECCSF